MEKAKISGKTKVNRKDNGDFEKDRSGEETNLAATGGKEKVEWGFYVNLIVFYFIL